MFWRKEDVGVNSIASMTDDGSGECLSVSFDAKLGGWFDMVRTIDESRRFGSLSSVWGFPECENAETW